MLILNTFKNIFVGFAVYFSIRKHLETSFLLKGSDTQKSDIGQGVSSHGPCDIEGTQLSELYAIYLGLKMNKNVAISVATRKTKQMVNFSRVFHAKALHSGELFAWPPFVAADKGGFFRFEL